MPPSSSTAPGAASRTLVPYGFNPFFTGRAKALHDLRAALVESRAAVLHGPERGGGTAGIGKTATAVAYALRHRDEYQTVLWLRGDDPCAVIEDCLGALAALGTGLEPGPPWDRAPAALREWLDSHERWLLIVDNADKSELVDAVLPEQPRGHVLALAQHPAASIPGVSRSVLLPELPPEEALRFLFKRTGRVDNDPVERRAASDLVAQLAGVPQGLELAGAFLSATRRTFREYLALWRDRRATDGRGASDASGEPAITLAASLCWEEAHRTAPDAVAWLQRAVLVGRELLPLKLLRDLSPDADPAHAPLREDVPGDGTPAERLLEPLVRLGFLRRAHDPAWVVLHPSVQRFVARQMDHKEADGWIERATRAVERHCLAEEADGRPRDVLPLDVLPWLALAATLARTDRLRTAEGARLSEQTVTRYTPLAGFAVTEPLYLVALDALEASAQDGRAVADLADDLARHYLRANKRPLADRYFVQALAARERAFGPNHAEVAAFLDELGRRYDEQGRYRQADEYYRRSLAVREQIAGKRHPDVATYLLSLGRRHAELARHDEADQCFRKAAAIQEEAYGQDHPAVASSLHELACWLTEQGRHTEAEPCFERAIGIARRVLPSDHPDLGIYLHRSARFYHLTDRPRQAELLYKQALVRAEHMPRPHLAAALNDLGSLYHQRRKYAKAEPLLEQALAVAKKSLPLDHPNVAICSNNLAALYAARRRYADAEPLYQQALAIHRRHLPADHPDLLTTLENYRLLLRKLRRAEDAARIEDRLGEIRAQIGAAGGAA